MGITPRCEGLSQYQDYACRLISLVILSFVWCGRTHVSYCFSGQTSDHPIPVQQWIHRTKRRWKTGNTQTSDLKILNAVTRILCCWKQVVLPGTTLHMECLWIRKFGKPSWSISNKNKYVLHNFNVSNFSIIIFNLS